MNYLKNKSLEKQRKFQRRRNKVASKIKSLEPDFRLVIDKSLLYISAQVLDKEGKVLGSITDKDMQAKTKTERAALAGATFGKILKDQKITKITFDRGGYLYHGRIKAFAEGLRSSGVEF